jgi:molybdate transport repressor ModE-like protein
MFQNAYMAVNVDFSLSWLTSTRLPTAHVATLLRLLAAVRAGGSLKQAAEAMGLSYRFAWGLLGEAGRAFGVPLVEFRRGKGARPTALGEKLIWADGLVRRALDTHLGELRREIETGLAETLPQRLPQLRIHASHDLALPLLATHCAGRADVEIAFRGADDCLAALAQERCDLAGFHVADALPRAAAAAAALGRWLDPRKHLLIHFVTREQGLIARPDSHVRNVNDLARPGVRFIHRQSASDPDLPGQKDWSVAAAVAQGHADAGFGLRPDAVRFNLDFVPLAVERYFLACSRLVARRPSLRLLLGVLRSPNFRQQVSHLPGYDPSKSGVREPLDAALNWVSRARSVSRRRRSNA